MARTRKGQEARVSFTFFMEERVKEAIMKIADDRTLNISLYLERLLLEKMPGLKGTVDTLRAEAKQVKLFEEGKKPEKTSRKVSTRIKSAKEQQPQSV